MLAPFLFAALAFVGSTVAAPAAELNTTIVPCGVTLSHEAFLAAESYFQEHKKAADPKASAVTLNVYFHIISQDNTVYGGQIPDGAINQQLNVLNQFFSGTGLSWRIAGVERLIRPDWYRVGVGSPAYQQFKDQRRQGGPADLNVYTIGSFTDSTLGYATFPDEYRSRPRQDGVVVVADTFPGGNIQNNNLGRILVHETGHWVGLYHTFENFGQYQNGCYGPGDMVDDTPAEATPANGCPNGRNTCNSPGNDPINNHMDYTTDSCRYQFTQGQVNRFRDQVRTYRGINV